MGLVPVPPSVSEVSASLVPRGALTLFVLIFKIFAVMTAILSLELAGGRCEGHGNWRIHRFDCGDLRVG